ncbi:hypothetical protein BVRB_3g064320 [Beta vulgaris subsp. vulgaris]|nr:hypothetical protein BVRB_3g064320 [Beta vulgaris subsp. vulgaris]
MALLVGCNYTNTQYQLHGCINDVVSMQELLVDRFGFEPESIELLIDEGPGSKLLPTGVNIKKALKKMIDEAEAGDVLFFHYSGHGTLVPSKHHLKREEAIVPCDFNLITDVDFRQLVNGLPKGASFTILSDSCHSGGLIDKEKEQIGPNTLPPTAQYNKNLGLKNRNSKKVSVESIMDHLSSLTNLVQSEIGAHLITLFGDDASLKFRFPELDLDQFFGPHRPDSGILLSGCQSNETSADISGVGPNGQAHGAFSYAVQSVLKAQHGSLSNKEVVVMAREILEKERIEGQHPCLYCSDENANSSFLMWDIESNK